MNPIIKKTILFFVFFWFSNIFGYSQSYIPLTLYQQFNGPFDYTIIGNTHNPYDNWISPPQAPAMLSSSSASLNLAANQTIVGAYLIWTGIGDGTTTTINLNGNAIIPDFVNIAYPFPTIPPSFPFFSAVKDITSYVQSFGNGLYQISNFNLSSILLYYYSNTIQFAGWNIIIVYSNPTLPNKQLNIYDGLQYVIGNSINSVNIPIDNLNVTNTSGAKMTYIVFNGSPNFYGGEVAQINGQNLSNALNPINNPYNGTNSFTGSTSSWNMDVDSYDISNFILVGNSSATITMSTNALRLLSNVITSIQSELPDATISLDSITGQDICQNHDLTLDYTVYNVNSNDTLLAGTPISVFVNNNVLLSTVTLPSNILIGDSLSLSTLVTIPQGISSPFTLSMVVNQNASQLGVYPESNFGNNTSNDSTISLTTVVYPNFGNIGP
ncbi:MAG: hypothetical protein ACKOXP_07315, partial [Flavobacteriales bacterium]